MIRALYTAASGMNAQQTNVDNIANNLANASTAGYKTRRAQFQDLLYQTMTQPGSSASQQTTVPAGLQLGLGTTILWIWSFKETDSSRSGWRLQANLPIRGMVSFNWIRTATWSPRTAIRSSHR